MNINKKTVLLNKLTTESSITINYTYLMLHKHTGISKCKNFPGKFCINRHKHIRVDELLEEILILELEI